MKRPVYTALGWVVWKVGRPLLRRKLGRGRGQEREDGRDHPVSTAAVDLDSRVRASARSKAAKKAARTRKSNAARRSAAARKAARTRSNAGR